MTRVMTRTNFATILILFYLRATVGSLPIIKVSISSSNGKVFQLVTHNKQKMQTFFNGFDLTFMINFDGKCHSESEQLFGLYVSHSHFY
jgi:hypothetical protein